MIGVFMFWKGLSFDDIGSSGDGLLDDEPISEEIDVIGRPSKED